MKECKPSMQLNLNLCFNKFTVVAQCAVASHGPILRGVGVPSHGSLLRSMGPCSGVWAHALCGSVRRNIYYRWKLKPAKAIAPVFKISSRKYLYIQILVV